MLLPRSVILSALGLLLLATSVMAGVNKGPPVITLLGDSITAGLGLPERDAPPAQLQSALKAMGVEAVVRGAGVSGDTTAGGLARLDFSVQPDTRVCVIELGANDYLQSVDPKAMEANLTRIVQRLKARRIAVVLTASASPRSGSGAYGREFDAVFPAVARREHVALAANVLVGIEDKVLLKQADGLHPNPAGVKLLAARLAPTVARVLRAN